MYNSLFLGLTDEEAERSRQDFGENSLSRRRRKGLLKSFAESFGDPMVKILMIALAVNIIFLFRHSNWFESIGIAVAILLATLVSTLSEYGSESAFQRLQEEASRIKCRVRRGGALKEIPVDQVVVGDIVRLQAGDRIPADGIIVEGRLEVDQSALNGESKEAVKQPFSEGAEGFLDPERLFAGTVCCAGEGLALVKAVGDNTAYGRIGSEIQEETRESPLRVRLGNLAGSIGKFGYIAAAVTAFAYFFNVIALDNRFDPTLMMFTLSQPGVMFGHVMKAATLAVTVIVMAVPEGLPMMITVVLSANMRRMLKDNVLVRKLTGIETAGSLNILFTDKTGTLTRGKLEVTQFVSGAGKIYPKTEPIPEKLRVLLRDAVSYNCAASMENAVAIGGNATDRAAIEFVSRFGHARPGVERRETVPFTSDNKYMQTTVAGAWDARLIKGAPEKILPLCDGYYDDSGEVKGSMNPALIGAITRRMAEDAVRIIAVAVAEASDTVDWKYKLVGLLGIRDGLRREAVDGVKMVRGAGIQTVMITGDSRPTALAVAREAGIVTSGRDLVLTSGELNSLSDDELARCLPNLRVVARALPSDKSRLVRVAQQLGLVTGMTGDGVNDAPALKQADIGFAMGSGAEIAKEAGDIVILDDNFNSIAKAVCYGRAIFKSIRKFLIYQMSICMCAVAVTVVGPLIGVDFPITVIQMLWVNIVMDTLAGLAFSGELARRQYMKEPPKHRDEPIINSYMMGQIATNSIYTALLCLFFLKSPLTQGIFGSRGNLYMMTAFFALFMFCAIFTSFCARTHRVNLFDYISANKPFLWIMGIISVVQIFIIYRGGTVFRTAGLEPAHLLIVVMLAFTIIPVDMLRKYLLRKRTAYAGT
ncbi:MAG: calcium-translocating P-type ATPase, PMCA-type [Defluviitaleaceae bacterium]|nr:calcium-translocating P-type ATPase, PMCA-type [Defluviitaleaceae bacterium]